jgi:PAS domain S-box-containing protein
VSSKPYRSDELKSFFKFPKGKSNFINENKLPIAINFIEEFQSLGNTFSFIIDFTTMKYLFVSKSTEQITGHKEWEKEGVEFAMSLYHPEDEPIARKIHERKVNHTYSVPVEDRGKYKYTHDFRIKHVNGHYIRINHHALHINFDELGNPIAALCICNDITDLKKSTILNLEISKLNDQGGYTSILKESFPLPQSLNISSREYEVLSLLSNGETNKEIAEKLFISEHTVRDHRRNMLKKNNARTVGELVSLAWQNELF